MSSFFIDTSFHILRLDAQPVDGYLGFGEGHGRRKGNGADKRHFNADHLPRIWRVWDETIRHRLALHRR